MGDRVVDAVGHLVHREVRDRAVQRRGADEGVDTRLRRVFHRVPAAVDVAVLRAREAADHRLFRAPRDFAHRAEIAFGGDRKAGLDDVDAHVVEQLGDLELFVMGHGGAGGLLAVPQSGVEDDDTVLAGLRRHAVLGRGVRFIGHVRNSFALLLGAFGAEQASSERSRRYGTLRGGLGEAGRAAKRRGHAHGRPAPRRWRGQVGSYGAWCS